MYKVTKKDTRIYFLITIKMNIPSKEIERNRHQKNKLRIKCLVLKRSRMPLASFWYLYC